MLFKGEEVLITDEFRFTLIEKFQRQSIFPQIVSARSTRVGCAAISNCRRTDIGLTGYTNKVLMCIYAPG